MTHVLRYAARTDRGLLRANNQDSVFAGDRLLVIADGMGGHAAGDVASRLVVAAFVDLDELPLGSDMVRPLTSATHEGNAAIAEMVQENPEFDGMGTTLTALLFDGSTVALAHVGDSRAYLYRNGVLHQISHDDTFVQSLVDDGRITADEAAHHPQRSLLLRALNGTDMDPSITMRETSPGDRFLICSDGLSDVVSPESIADALAGSDPDQVADTLIQLALVGGGPDNVTVIVADVIETGGLSTWDIPGGGIDPEATGPMQSIHRTQKMPRVPLPPIPEDVAAKPDYASVEEGPEPHGEDDPYDEDEFDEDEDTADYVTSAHPTAEFGDRDAAALPLGERRRGERRMVAAPPRRRWHRRWAFAFALVVLIGVGLTGSYLWASTKYYVGDNQDQVAVFKGVNDSLLGWKFASVQENSCGTTGSGCTPLKVNDLVQAARDQVNAGIPVSTLADARAVMTRLTSQQLPPCPTGAGRTAVVPGSSAVSSPPVLSSGAAGSTPTAATSTPGPSPVPTHPGSLPHTPVHSTPAPTPAHVTPRTPATKATPGSTTTPARTARRTTAAKSTPARATSPRPTTARTVPTHTTSAVRKPPTTTPPPVPVTTTVTITVSAFPPAVAGQLTSGQRLRDQLIPLLKVSGRAVPKTTRELPTVAATDPITRADTAAVRPTVTVFTTTTSTPPFPSRPSSSGTPLVSPVAEPGVTCRLVS